MTPSTNKCCEKCIHLGLPEAWAKPHSDCPCHKPIEPSVCDRENGCGLPFRSGATCLDGMPCGDHEPSEEKKLVDRQMNQIIDNKELTTRGPLHEPSEVCNCGGHEPHGVACNITLAQQEEASWSPELKRQCEVRGLPYRDVAYLVGEIVATVEAQAEKRVAQRACERIDECIASTCNEDWVEPTRNAVYAHTKDIIWNAALKNPTHE